jgi:hypothetical protein
MDPKKRTTIIVLLFLTILLGIASVFIATQVQRNNAAEDSQAGNFTFEADLKNGEFAEAFSCEHLKHNISLLEIDIETTDAVATTQCNYTVDGKMFTVDLVNNDSNYSDADVEEVTAYFATQNLSEYSVSSSEVNDDFSAVYIGEDIEGICHLYYGANYLDGTYIRATLGSEESCVAEGGTETLSTISSVLVNFVYTFLGNL